MTGITGLIIKVLSWFSTTIINIKNIFESKNFGQLFLLLLFLIVVVGGLTILIKKIAKNTSPLAIFGIILVVFFFGGLVASYMSPEECNIGETCSANGSEGIISGTPESQIPVIDLNDGAS